MHSESKYSSGVGEKYSSETQIPDWAACQSNIDMLGSLNDGFRQQLTLLNTNKRVSQSSPINIVADEVGNILSHTHLDKEMLDKRLAKVFKIQKAIYNEAHIPRELRKRQYISGSGLVMSPDHCITTICDGFRVGLFIKSVDTALNQLLKTKSQCDSDLPVHIVYPACGPFAPLLIPLLAYYQKTKKASAADIQVTFIDVQEGAVIALASLIRAMGLESYVREVVCQDACRFQKNDCINMVILEAMQHGFSREGHLRIAKHFADLLEPEGVFLPQRITIEASLNTGQSEYVDQWNTEDKTIRTAIQKERTCLGGILNIDLEFLRTMKTLKMDEYTELVECSSLKIPELAQTESEQILMINTKVNVFGNEWLEEYDSGITHPLPDRQVCINFIPKAPQPGDLLLNSGDSVKFYYCLNGLPGFLATKSTIAATNDDGAHHQEAVE